MVIILLVIAAVIYLSYLFSRYISYGATRFGDSKYMSIVDRMAVGQDRSILIIKVQDRYYMISVTAQSVQILKELEELPPDDGKAPKAFDMDSFKNIFQNIVKPKK